MLLKDDAPQSGVAAEATAPMVTRGPRKQVDRVYVSVGAGCVYPGRNDSARHLANDHAIDAAIAVPRGLASAACWAATAEYQARSCASPASRYCADEPLAGLPRLPNRRGWNHQL